MGLLGIIIIILLVLLFAFLLYYAIRRFTAPPTPVSIVIAGPGQIQRGQSAQYRVGIQFPAALSASAATRIVVQIWEYDATGDDLLLNNVRVTIPAGRVSGTAVFSLLCDQATGKLVGANGSSDAESSFAVYGYTERSGGANDFSGGSISITCLAETQ
jgi:hypothetical protein